MNNNELILGLIDRLNPSCKPSTLSLWMDDLITQAGNTVFNATTQLKEPTNNDLKNYVKARNSYNAFDKTRAKYFCLIPISNNEWKVFILDQAKKVLSQTENYSGEIKDNNNNTVKKPFLLEL